MRTPDQIKNELANTAPTTRGLHPDERRLLLEQRAERARERGDHDLARHRGSQATEAMLASEAGETQTGWNAEVPHYAGEITVHRIETEEEVPVHIEHSDQHQAAA